MRKVCSWLCFDAAWLLGLLAAPPTPGPLWRAAVVAQRQGLAILNDLSRDDVLGSTHGDFGTGHFDRIALGKRKIFTRNEVGWTQHDLPRFVARFYRKMHPHHLAACWLRHGLDGSF